MRKISKKIICSILICIIIYLIAGINICFAESVKTMSQKFLNISTNF